MKATRKLFVLCMALILALPMIFCVPVMAAGAEYIPQYRMYNKNTGEHFYTTSANERNHLILAGWNYEGVNCLIPTTSDTPMYRLYNKRNGDHHYTTSAHERDVCVKNGWTYEGIGWYSGGDTPVYRLYNPKSKGPGAHHYTSSITERDHLVKNGWNDEGIGWYGKSAANFVDPNPAPTPPANNSQQQQQSTSPANNEQISGLTKPFDKINNPSANQIPAEAKALIERDYNRVLAETSGWAGSGITYHSVELRPDTSGKGEKIYKVIWSATFTKDQCTAEFLKASGGTGISQSVTNKWLVGDGYRHEYPLEMAEWTIGYFISVMNTF